LLGWWMSGAGSGIASRPPSTSQTWPSLPGLPAVLPHICLMLHVCCTHLSCS
jgi:hypothetical protein